MKDNQQQVGRKWFDGEVSEEEVIAKCKEVWAMDGTDSEAAFYSNVSKYSISRYLEAHPELKELRNRLKENPVLLARKTVIAGIQTDKELAFKYLERRVKEFKPKSDIMSDDKAIPAPIIQLDALLPNNGDQQNNSTDEKD